MQRVDSEFFHSLSVLYMLFFHVHIHAWMLCSPVKSPSQLMHTDPFLTIASVS